MLLSISLKVNTNVWCFKFFEIDGSGIQTQDI